MAPVTCSEVLVHGHAVSYAEAGADSGGPVVVLVHGIASRAAQWEAVMARLGQSCHVIAPDLLGHGSSAKPREDYSLGAEGRRWRRETVPFPDPDRKAPPMDVLYTAQATARGGREGEVVSDDGVLDLELAHPKELGGPADSDKTNPEQLFAAGYAACFHSALKRLAGQQKIDVEGSSITARVGLGIEGKGFGLTVTLAGELPTLDAAAGEALMEAAHQVCPYSNATRGNVEVTLEVV